MQNSLLKQAIALIGLLVTGLISLIGVPSLQSPTIEIGQWRISPSLYSISINHNQAPQAFYKISPYDDLIFYEDGTWDKVIHGSEQILNESLVNPPIWQKKIVWPLRALLRKPVVSFTSLEKGILYKAFQREGKLIIKKKIAGLPKKAVGFGNSFVFTKDDEIYDSEGRVYVVSELEKDRTEVSGITFLAFKNPKNTGQVVLPIGLSQKVVIDKIYRLVEVKVEFPNAVEKVDISQEIVFEENSKR